MFYRDVYGCQVWRVLVNLMPCWPEAVPERNASTGKHGNNSIEVPIIQWQTSSQRSQVQLISKYYEQETKLWQRSFSILKEKSVPCCALLSSYSDSPKGSSDAVVPGVRPDQMPDETCDACYSALCVLSSLPTAMHFIII